MIYKRRLTIDSIIGCYEDSKIVCAGQRAWNKVNTQNMLAVIVIITTTTTDNHKCWLGCTETGTLIH